MSEDRADNVMKAKIAEQVERYDDMKDFMNKIAAMNEPLSNEERNLLSVAYKNVVGTRRASWRVIAQLETKRNDDETRQGREAEKKKEYREKIEKELNEICDEVIKLLQDSLIPNVAKDDVESEVFYLKMKGDYYRYKVEVASDEGKVKAYAEQSEDAYNKAYDRAKEKMANIHPIRLGLALNFSVYYYEIKKEPQKACELAKDAFEAAIAEIDDDQTDTMKDSTLILQLLRDNLTLWTNEIDNDEQQVDGDE